jgi:hypothetical protein
MTKEEMQRLIETALRRIELGSRVTYEVRAIQLVNELISYGVLKPDREEPFKWKNRT